MSAQLPSLFLERMKTLLGNEYESFLASYQAEPPVSLRINPLKKTGGFKNEESVPWCKWGKYLESRPSFVMDPYFHSGAYYVQEASSMIVARAIDFSTNLKVLDLCAAPGGKSTLLSSFMTTDSLLVSNEIRRDRVGILSSNIIRWGLPNIMVTHNDPNDFLALKNFFDVVLVDAPCSGEGMFRKDHRSIGYWSQRSIEHTVEKQKRILKNVSDFLKPNGLLIYSTCTFSLEENEMIIEWLLQNRKEFELVNLQFPKEWNIANGIHAGKNISENTYRLYPHMVKGEGLFLTCLKKREGENALEEIVYYKEKKRHRQPIPKSFLPLLENYLHDISAFELENNNNCIFAYPKNLSEDMQHIRQRLNTLVGGIFLGEIKGEDFVPSHHLALSIIRNKNIPSMELDREEALRYLKKADISPNEKPADGWVLATFEGQALGWLKVINGRCKNYLPKNWRIQKEIELVS